MSTPTMAPRAVDARATLAGQVRQLQEHYPDLYAYLKARDQAIERALRRIPSGADIELAAGAVNACARLERALRDLQPGVAALSAPAQRESEPQGDEDDDVYIGC